VIDLGQLVRLEEESPTVGDPVGAPGAQVVYGLPEEIEIELTLGELLAEDHILAVFDPDGATIISCGPIGAYTFEEGDDLAFGLRSQGDSPYAGIALIDAEDEDDDDPADVEVYIVNNSPAPGTPEA